VYKVQKQLLNNKYECQDDYLSLEKLLLKESIKSTTHRSLMLTPQQAAGYVD